ncbi:MAG TPA: hypothetical protein VM889_01725 [Candidatus Thermoplasmatota archaeon]|nr:hypothetical protein [Candidatus Thermoplasmatota archaeon]
MQRETPAADAAEGLRRWASGEPLVRHLRTVLPALAEAGDRPGLFVDAAATPWIDVEGDLRVSVLRLWSVAIDGSRTLVGQVQATASRDGDRRLRAYVHRPEMFHTEEQAGEDAWFLQVLDAHYERGGAPLALA